MGNNHRFKLSHLMPNSWFYKLRDMKRGNPSQRNPARIIKRPSSTTTPKPFPITPNQSHNSYLHTKRRSLEKLPLSPLHHNPKALDIHFPKEYHSPKRSSCISKEDDFQDLQLRPIRTRPAVEFDDDESIRIDHAVCPSSPRLRSRRLHVYNASSWATTVSARNGAKASFAVVKTSSDPLKDFRESMVEMIVENDIRASEDLEELLACYLSLNSKEYHGVIMKVFRQIWLELNSLCMLKYE